MSEKLDGVRAIWNPERRVFLSRNEKEFFAPEWFKKLMPMQFLDGELFVGRKKFDKTVSIVRSHSKEGWEKVRFHVFDMYPVDGGPEHDFEFRQKAVRRHLDSTRERFGDISCVWAQQTQCGGLVHLTHLANKIADLGGEGVMLRQPGSLYEKKRSGTLLKVKRFLDSEAEVVGHVPGRGKHLGRLGALDCRLEDGTLFQVGTGFSDREREKPPKIGSKITVRYQELTKDGVPRFPVFVTERDYE